MKRIVLLIALIGSGCGQAPAVVHQGQVIDPDFKAYVASFEAAASSHNVVIDDSKLQITYGSPGAQYYALCAMEAMGTPVITVARDFVNQDATMKEMILFHEMGHCLLGRHHNDGAKSLMNSAMVPESSYSTDKSFYIDELFSVLNK